MKQIHKPDQIQTKNAKAWANLWAQVQAIAQIFCWGNLDSFDQILITRTLPKKKRFLFWNEKTTFALKNMNQPNKRANFLGGFLAAIWSHLI